MNFTNPKFTKRCSSFLDMQTKWWKDQGWNQGVRVRTEEEETITYFQLNTSRDISMEEAGFDDVLAVDLTVEGDIHQESGEELKALQEQVTTLVQANKDLFEANQALERKVDESSQALERKVDEANQALERKVDAFTGANRSLSRQVKTMKGFIRKLLVLESKTDEFKRGVVFTVKSLRKRVESLEKAMMTNTGKENRMLLAAKNVLDECLEEVEKTHSHMNTFNELIDHA